MLALSFNNWDDYGISTTLNATLYIDKKVALNFSLKLLIEDDDYSPKKLNELCDNGWNGFFPIPNLNYVSVPSDIDFYNILIAKIGLADTQTLLMLIRDAGYLVNVIKDGNAERLTSHGNFITSPLREAGARKSFQDGWKLLDNVQSSIQDFTLNTINKNGVIEPISFHFNSEHLPYDINVLIGENGIGKSFTLKTLVEYWLGVDSGSKKILDASNHAPFDHYPNISKFILISYSPFEEFTIDLSKTDLKDKDAYKYFGFRKINTDSAGNEKIGISRNLPARDSVSSIMKSIEDDHEFGFIHHWTSKFDTIFSVLKTAIDFDFIALELSEDMAWKSNPALVTLHTASNNKYYLSIDNTSFNTYKMFQLDINMLINHQAGVVFIKDKHKIEISSGQRLFCYIVINVVGQIRKDSLIVIDEPELFLHPTLEIEFISLLKTVLKAFNSKAILATHSLAMAREVPAKCIHVYRQHNGKVEIDHPPFETFGGDMQRISSYVFGDSSITKPFDLWVEEKLRLYNNPRDLIYLLGQELNEEMLIKILNSGGKNGI
ncbi:ATP-binding protein [Aeromonas sp. MR19]|nr:ATP-binding protein [Aeromonas sp. MR19]